LIKLTRLGFTLEHMTVYPRISSRWPSRFGFILALIALSSCTFTFLPLTPKPLEIPPAVLIGDESVLTRSQAEIVLRIKLEKVPSEGYLSAALYLEAKKVAEDSKLIAPNAQNLEFKLGEAKLGKYRAYLFWQGNVVRQFEFNLE
jgi:hypothetical protein